MLTEKSTTSEKKNNELETAKPTCLSATKNGSIKTESRNGNCVNTGNTTVKTITVVNSLLGSESSSKNEDNFSNGSDSGSSSSSSGGGVVSVTSTPTQEIKSKRINNVVEKLSNGPLTDKSLVNGEAKETKSTEMDETVSSFTSTIPSEPIDIARIDQKLLMALAYQRLNQLMPNSVLSPVLAKPKSKPQKFTMPKTLSQTSKFIYMCIYKYYRDKTLCPHCGLFSVFPSRSSFW